MLGVTPHPLAVQNTLCVNLPVSMYHYVLPGTGGFALYIHVYSQ